MSLHIVSDYQLKKSQKIVSDFSVRSKKSQLRTALQYVGKQCRLQSLFSPLCSSLLPLSLSLSLSLSALSSPLSPLSPLSITLSHLPLFSAGCFFCVGALLLTGSL